MKVINSRLHGIIDYLVVLFLPAAPTLFGLPPHHDFVYLRAGRHSFDPHLVDQY